MSLTPTLDDTGNLRRAQSSWELFADGFVHAFGLVGGATGAAILLAYTATQPGGFKLIAICVYAVCFMAMLACSAAYNLGYYSRWRGIFRRCDHCAIFLMIAGTYTPFTTQLMDTLPAFGLTGAIWLTCLFGIVMKLVEPDVFERWSVALYLALGWISVIVFGPIIGGCGLRTLLLLASGGVLYTVGVIFHAWQRLPFQNAIWHVFVLAAAICHYWAVMDGIVLGPLAA